MDAPELNYVDPAKAETPSDELETAYQEVKQARDTADLASYVKQFEEASFVAFTKLFGRCEGQIVEISITARAVTGPGVLDALMDAAKFGKSKYHMSLARPTENLSQPPSKAAAADVPAPQAPAKPQSAPATATPPPPTAPATPAIPVSAPAPAAGEQVIHAVKMTATPREDGKVRLEWYAAGHQYPDITSTLAADRAAILLTSTGDWTAEHFATATSYQVRHKITWRNSDKVNTKGNPYKDIVSVILE